VHDVLHAIFTVHAHTKVYGRSKKDNRAGKGIMGGILWTIIVVLFAFWVAGFVLHFGGALIHLLLFVALVLIIVNVLTGRGARV
jgi:hypothetical protein